MPKTVNPDPAWTDTLDVPLPHETMDAADVAVPDTRLLANDKWLKKEFGARLDALERAVWPTTIQAELTASETDSAAHLWRFEYTLSTNRGSIANATLDFGDGSPVVTLSNPAQPGFVTHAYPDAGATYTAVLTVQTSEGVSQRVERVVGTLPPLPQPTLTIEPDAQIQQQYYIAGAGYSSVPSGLHISLRLDWGDGTVVTLNRPWAGTVQDHVGSGVDGDLWHKYGSYDPHTVTLTATDQYGRTAVVTQPLNPKELFAQTDYYVTASGPARGMPYDYTALLDSGNVTYSLGDSPVPLPAANYAALTHGTTGLTHETGLEFVNNRPQPLSIGLTNNTDGWQQVEAQWTGAANTAEVNGIVQSGLHRDGIHPPILISFFDADGVQIGQTSTYETLGPADSYTRHFNVPVTLPPLARRMRFRMERISSLVLTNFSVQA